MKCEVCKNEIPLPRFYHWPDLATDIRRIEEKLDTVIEAMPKCNCDETHVFNQALQRTSWYCPIHGAMEV